MNSGRGIGMGSGSALSVGPPSGPEPEHTGWKIERLARARKIANEMESVLWVKVAASCKSGCCSPWNSKRRESSTAQLPWAHAVQPELWWSEFLLAMRSETWRWRSCYPSETGKKNEHPGGFGYWEPHSLRVAET